MHHTLGGSGIMTSSIIPKARCGFVPQPWLVVNPDHTNGCDKENHFQESRHGFDPEQWLNALHYVDSVFGWDDDFHCGLDCGCAELLGNRGGNVNELVKLMNKQDATSLKNATNV